jgi:hypothetical protein
VLQLAHVPRPGVVLEHRHRVGRDPLEALPSSSAVRTAKRVASSGTSSRRSRSGGMLTGITLSR